MNDCAICELVEGQRPSWVVYDDENVICFLPLQVEAFGHTIIAPKAHQADLFSAPAETLSRVLVTVQKLALPYQSAIGATGINLLHASGVAAGQSVPHLHFHLIPRFENDGLDLWPKLPETQDDKEELLEKLRL